MPKNIFVWIPCNIILFQKEKKKKGQAPAYNFSAIHLLHDPQGKTIG